MNERPYKRHESFLAILTGMGDAVMMIDVESGINYMNPVAEALTGWRYEEVAGQPIDAVFRLMDEQSRERLESPVLEVFRTSAPICLKNVLLDARDQKERFVDVAAAVDGNSDGPSVGCILIFRDVTERRRGERALGSEGLYRSLVDSQAEMLCRFRRDGTILFANIAYANEQGTTPEELIGTNFWNFLPKAERPGVAKRLDSLTPENPEVSIENRLWTVSGERWTLWTNRALKFDENGRVTEAQSAGIDITERKQMEHALQEADRRKDEFLATLAHELRDPLAPIRNSLQIMKQAKGSPELSGAAQEAIDRQVSHLVRLVDDLLDVSRITRDKLELRRTRLELGDIIRQAVDICRPSAEGNQQTLEMTLPQQPVYLQADPVRLAQVMNNLLINACKYTPPGGCIRVSMESAADETVITVRDSGIGMPPDKLQSIFEMFEQVRSAGARPAGGLGVGLTLVRRLVELHGGTVSAASAGVGKGSEFVVRLPTAGAERKGETTELPLIPLPARSLRVLVVDDNRDSADSLAALLRLNGHETHVAYDGLAAVRETEKLRPQVVLLDRGLPLLDGAGACRRIREAPWGKSIAIMAVTGWGQEEDRRESERAGFDHHLTKPVDYELLSTLLAELPGR